MGIACDIPAAGQPGRSSQRQELSLRGLSASIVFQQNVDKPMSHSLMPSAKEAVPQCNLYEVPEYAAMMIVTGHHCCLRTQTCVAQANAQTDATTSCGE